MRLHSAFLILTLVGLTAGCVLGPGTVIRDRFDYSATVADSWKSQMLLNFVRTRYGDTGVFLDVGQIVAGYTVESTVTASAAWNLFSVVNGIDNPYGGDLRAHPADAEFYALLERMRRVQLSGGIGMRVRRLERDEAVLMTFRQKVDPAVEADLREIRQLLGLDPGAREFRVVYGSVASSDKEIAILTRSALEILVDLSSFITVPEEHVAERRVSPTAEPEQGPAGPIRPLIQIKSSRDRPADAFVAVPYRDVWFWIDDRDVPSKRMFSFIMFVFALVEPGSKDAPPVLTIPTG
jgi:hypothetical protein